MSFQQDFGDSPHLSRLLLRRRVQRDIRQAGDTAAFDAQKVWVFGFVRVLLVAEFKTPHVIAECRARDETGLAQVDQISVNGRFVEPLGN